jgi:hypothetical protein
MEVLSAKPRAARIARSFGGNQGFTPVVEGRLCQGRSTLWEMVSSFALHRCAGADLAMRIVIRREDGAQRSTIRVISLAMVIVYALTWIINSACQLPYLLGAPLTGDYL